MVNKILKRIGFYIRIWIAMSKNSFLVYMNQKTLLAMFLLGKTIRFVFMLVFIYFLVSDAGSLVGYDLNQVVFILLTFNFVDIVSQFFFREVYRFRPLLVSGDFDLILQKPMSALFRVLFGGADVIDLMTIPPVLVALFYFGAKLNPGFSEILLYSGLIVNSLLIALAFHIAVISLAIITLEVDYTIMMYRDLTNLGRLPIEVYGQPLKSILTYVIPVGLMVTVPARVLMGLGSITTVFVSFIIAALLLFVSFRFWKIAMTRYTSASS